ncbi:AAA family ATPase [Chryseobacterium candidae]|uniref:ATPase AAA-type core domain-containing protein n=1 Tax=Chryseobacterium candidae TaxID=1978493 RepID=A0ABY2R5D8_9FLAO|nr:AAA family ATPase [Chryseobacterium candidae]THV58422.1 hypothetical protein EK417_12415 [Chryseobacterium candidae]
MSFKLLAIRPLEGCNPKFLKNLNPNEIYKFYQEYDFLDIHEKRIECFKNHIEVNRVKNNSDFSVINKLYGEKINISAVVGKNGSGKSALVELLIVCINQLSLKLIDGELHSDAELKSATENENEKIKCEIFYKINNDEFLKLIINDENFSFANLNNKEESFNLKDFFYTEVINYSIYAFNSNIIGKWVDGLFHKNDSYQIPIVINPKREGKDNPYWAGIIDINNEHFLLKQRLLNNILQPIKDNNLNFRRIGDNMIAVKVELNKKEIRDFFIYSNDENQIGRKITEYEDKKKLYENFKNDETFDFSVNIEAYNQDAPLLSCHNIFEILNSIKSEFKLKDIPDSDLQMQLDFYIIYKVISICDKYVEYRKFVDVFYKIYPDKEYKRYKIKVLEFINHLKKYRSHITYKLFQAINYIKYYDNVWGDLKLNDKIDLDLISEKLIEPSIENESLIEVLFPPIFDTEVYLKNEKDNDLIKLSELSSGEQQLIHSVSSIVYHLNNLNSVKGEKIVKYKYINLVFDEIELYFHPEFQRKFIHYILRQINSINLNDISGINILFITHSPFILSDIPKQNVLFIDNGNSEDFKRMNTFGANISDLLAEGFFFSEEEGNKILMGDFVKEKIEETIKIIKEKDFAKKEKAKQIIDLIDEPLIRTKLEEMYYEYFDSEKLVQIEMLELERLAKKYNKKIQ